MHVRILYLIYHIQGIVNHVRISILDEMFKSCILRGLFCAMINAEFLRFQCDKLFLIMARLASNGSTYKRTLKAEQCFILHVVENHSL